MDENDKQNGATNTSDGQPVRKFPKDGLGLLKIDHEYPSETQAKNMPPTPQIQPPAPVAETPAVLPTSEVEQEPSTTPASRLPEDFAQSEAVEPTAVAEPVDSTGPIEQMPEDEASAPEDSLATPALEPTVPKKRTRRPVILIAAGVLVVALLGLAAWWFFGANSTKTTSSSETQLTQINQSKLGITFTVVNGTAQYLSGEKEWQDAATNAKLEEGDSIRTGTDSRAVLALSDGSVIRLGSESTIKLISLKTDEIKIEQVAGTIYSRVSPNAGRHYSVNIGDVAYEALGTAFTTIKDTTRSGVQVFQSSVKTSASSEVVTEGKQYFTMHTDAALQNKVTDINIDTLAGDTFIAWNAAEDEKDAGLKDKLGILPSIKERADAKEQERQTVEETTSQQVEKENETVGGKKEETTTTPPAQTFMRGTMTLTVTSDNKKLQWSYTGKAIYGYKLAYSKSTITPTVENNDSIYISNMNETSLDLPTSRLPQGAYLVRVCAYAPGTGGDVCVDYSDYKIARNF